MGTLGQSVLPGEWDLAVGSRWTKYREGDQGIQQEKASFLERAWSQACYRGCSLLEANISNERCTAGQMLQP